MSRNFRCSLLFGCAAALVMLAGSPRPGQAAPPKSAPPPIYYHIQYFTGPGGNEIGGVLGMNNSGVMVGRYYANGLSSGFLYDPAINPTQAVDLNDVVDVPAGWTIAYATDVNDFGGLLVGIEKIAQRDSSQPDFEAHGLLVDMRSVPWLPIPLPDAAAGMNVCFGRHINNNGDIVATFPFDPNNIWGLAGAYLYNAGIYRDTGPDPAPTVLPLTLSERGHVALNDPIPGRPLQVAGRGADGNALRYTVGDAAPEVFALQLNAGSPALNGYGVICGRARVLKTKGNQYVWRPFRFDPETQMSPRFIGSESAQAGQIAWDINNDGDVILDHYLYRNSTLVTIDDCVSGPSGDFWRTSLRGVSHCTQRTLNGFPILGGTMNKLDPDFTWGCLLTPKTTPQQ